MLRKTGKFGIGLVMLAAFFSAGTVVLYFTVVLTGKWNPKYSIVAAFGAAFGVYALFDWFDLKPDDTEKLLELSLDDPPSANHKGNYSG